MTTTEELLERIDRRLQVLVAITANTAFDGLTKSEQVRRLASFGIDARAISEATGIKLTTVQPMVSRARTKE